MDKEKIHPALAGVGGSWRISNEVFTREVVKQKDQYSCGVACAEMLLAEEGIFLSQETIIIEGGVPISVDILARIMNAASENISICWRGVPVMIPGATDEQIIETLNKTGSWIAMLWQHGSRIGHYVIVDGKDEHGTLNIRDPWSPSKYNMQVEDFVDYWNFYVIFKQSK
ncbi:MAG: hypothetical protein N5P05_004675 (plasmid) [Chroococcopsis gigantea SAG 12.99]|jgi:ABC-type bacteriocin/lantibiotic exporter with double-glycine peptidase domain|nr:hypothetical protein [Chroococcopsis gigantea SAG 12.99]